MLWDSDPVDWDWYRHDQSQEAKAAEDEAEAKAEENAEAVREAKTGSETLPHPLPYAYIRTVYDVASDLAAGNGEDADLVGNALFLSTDGWEEAETRSAFDELVSTRRDVVEAVARYAHRLTMGVS